MDQQRFSLLLAVAFGFLFGIVVMTARQPQPDRFRMDLPHAAIALVDRAHGLVSDDDLAGFETMDFAPSFHQGDMYIFVLAADGVNLYHAADRTLVGTDFSRLSDVAGRPFGKRLVEDVSPDGVWHAWQWDNPVSRKREWKLTYARQTPQGHIVAAGIFAGGVNR